MRRDEHTGLTRWRSRPGRRLAGLVLQTTNRIGGRLAGTSTQYVVLLVTTLVGLTAAGILTVASAEIYDNVTDHDGVAGLDRPVLDQMIGWRTPSRNAWIIHATNLGSASKMPIIATVAALLIALWWRRWTPLLLMTLAGGGSLVMTMVGKAVVNRARPDHSLAVPPFENSPSFPSGHSLNSWVIFGMIAYLVAIRLANEVARAGAAATALVLAVAMGLSRVYLGLHWLTDVLVAWTLGTAWLIVVITGHRLALTVGRYGREGAPDRRPWATR